MTTSDDHEGRKLWRDVAVIVVLTAVLAVPSMFTRDLWNPDEPRYMEAAREMFVLHDYIIPHLNGQIYTDKPPLFFWMAGLLWKMGLGVMSARVLAALASLATLLCTYFFSRRFLKGDGPILATVATLGLLLFAVHARLGVIDPLHTLLIVATTLAGYLALTRSVARPGLWWMVAYGIAGLEVLVKGPVGFALPGTVLLAYALLDRKRVRAGGKVHIAGVALLLAIPLAWLIPAVMAGGPTYATDILLHKGLGYVVNSSSHPEPFYYFIVRGPVLLMPWVLLLPLPLYAAVKHRRDEGVGPAFFAAVWCAATFVFFSCMSAKRESYLLPMAPAVGMLVGWYLTSDVADRDPRWRAAGPWLVRLSLAVMGLTAAALMVATFFPGYWVEAAALGPDAAARVQAAWWRAEALALLALPAACCVAGWVWARAHPRRAVVALALTVVLTGTWFDLSAAPLFNETQSARAFCEDLRAHIAPADKLYFYNADFSGAISLYEDRAIIPILWRAEELWPALRDPNVVVLGDMRRYADALTASDLERYTVFQGFMGSRQMILLRGRAPVPAEPVPPAGER